MLSFADLEKALQPISRIGMDEVQFEARGDVIVLRPIRPHEEVIVGRYAREALAEVPEGEDTDQVSAMEYINRYKVMTLAFAVVQINDLDLRDQDYVVMPEKTDSGRPIRVPKHIAMRDLITKMWSPTMIRSAHTKYSQLLEAIAKEYVDLVETDPSDLDTEIARLEQELQRLKSEREARATGDSNVKKSDLQRIFEQSPPPAPPRSPTPQAAVVEPDPEPVTMDRMPTARDYHDLPDDDEEDIPEPPLPKPPGVREAASPKPPVIRDSFGDADDPEILAAEEARILAARRLSAAKVREARGDDSTATHPPRRTPPHMRGRGGISGGEVALASDEELAALGIPPNMVREDGMEATPEVLSPRGRRHRGQEQNLEIDPAPGDGKAGNPRFAGRTSRRGR